MPLADLRIDSKRLWDTLMETAAIGATPRGGLCRLTLTDDDKTVRDWFVAQAEAAGCTVTVDEVGNTFATRAGHSTDRAPIACGSHLDTQPTGGRFDGVLGVLAGLEVVRTLSDRGVETDAPVTVVNWTNEEGSRFAPAMMGSAAHIGNLSRDDTYACTDRAGARVGDELARIGYRGSVPAGQTTLAAYFELHIEQGPVLEQAGDVVGVVTGGQGLRWYDLQVAGAGGHAGTLPMPLRRDALVAAAEVIAAIEQVGREAGPHGVGTVGVVEVPGASRNTVPAAVRLTADLRHPDDAALNAMDHALHSAVAAVAERRGVEVTVTPVWHDPAIAFHPDCIGAVARAAETLSLPSRHMISGAGHDACNLARQTPTSMIFVPCKDGVSHQEHEYASPEHVAAGANVLLHAVLDRAGVRSG